MPLYEYQCDDCETTFELRRPMRASEEPVECPNCASEQVTRQVSLFAAFAKGSESTRNLGGGCACGGACACGAHSHN